MRKSIRRRNLTIGGDIPYYQRVGRAKRQKQAEMQRRQGRSQHLVAAGAVVAIIAVAFTAVYLGKQVEAPAPESEGRLAMLARDHAPTLGDADARVHIVEFLDPACGTCAMFYPMVKRWLDEAPGQIKLSVRHVPFHTGVEYAVQVLEASRNQDLYWETLEALLTSQRAWVTNHIVQQDRVLPAIAHVGLNEAKLLADMNSADVLARIEKDKQDAVALKVSATPEYYVNGRPLPSFGQQQLLDLVREELDKAY